MMLADWQNFLEIWSKVFGDLEKKRGEIRWRFGGNVFGDIGENRSAIFGKNVSATRRNHKKRGRRSYGNFILEFAME